LIFISSKPADRRHQYPRNSRPDDARAIKYGGVQGNGVDEILSTHHFHHEGLSRRYVKGIHEAEHGGEHKHMPYLHTIGECQDGQNKG
jgi:hypothetical protein